MPKQLGPERSHFGGEHGLITAIIGGTAKYYWRCEFCNWELGGKCFVNAKARIHLSGDPQLKNGQVVNLCTKAPDEIKQKFAKLERQKRQDKQQREMTRKRGLELMQSPVNKRRKSRQITLLFKSSQTLTDREVDDAWGLTCFGLDIPPNKLSDPLFKDVFHATQNSSKRFYIKMFIYIIHFILMHIMYIL